VLPGGAREALAWSRQPAGRAAGDSGAPPPAASNKVYIGLTDADGDFLSYAVDVVSLKLRKVDGSTVETLPLRSRVDFAELVDLTEFVTAATIPHGVYVAGTIRLDYANAAVSVEAGGAPRETRVVGRDGQPLGVVDLEVRLDERNQLAIGPGRPAFLQLDFDLAASHTVDVTTTPATAKASPFIVASLEPVTEKELRVRGPLKGADTVAGTYTVDVRPFNLREARLGEIVVRTTAETAFEIDGQTYTGGAGLQALAAMPSGTPTIAFGTLSVAERSYAAARVRAGSSVPGPRFDVLRGNVIARSGDSLTVRGLLGAKTVSVGQRIEAFGQAGGTAEAVTLDAQQGRVRLQLTQLAGTVVSAQPGELALNLAAIDGRQPGIFDFAGTGTSPAVDADPANYQVATGPMMLGGLTPGSPAAVVGFVAPFGEAPPDFNGRTVVDIETLRAVLGIGWGEAGTAAPFTRLDAGGLVINTANPDIGLRHHIAIGPRIVDLQRLATPLTIAPAQGPGLYAIGEPGRVEVFADFTRFAARLNEKLGGGARARAMSAAGRFDADSFTLTVREVSVGLVPAN